MNVLVTGGHGFIGRAVIARLLADEHTALAYDRASGFDILDAKMLTTAMRDIIDADAVIHLAGVLGVSELFDQPDLAVDVNVKGTLRVLEACAATGAAFVGITMPPVFPSVYTATKIAAHRLAGAWHHAHGVAVTHIKAFNVYGPGQAWGAGHPQKIVPTFASRSWRREPMPIWGDGSQVVDLVHVDDVAQNLVGAATHYRCSHGDNERGPWGCDYGSCEVYDAGTGHPVTVLEVAQRIAAITGCGLVEFLPMRQGEIAQHDLCASEFGPFAPGKKWDRFDETVASYRPDATAEEMARTDYVTTGPKGPLP